ncbi:MAG: DotU family type IV/VI secretion system protein [Holosporaceae bacterium]|jgi:type VI secretion system protein ImpK|nr:DotU family type IV/VI secretion system protein [Holosporaceae bacterium]
MQSVRSLKTSSGLSEMFGSFCLEVFNGKKNIENVDYKTLHKSISLLIKTFLELERSANENTREIIYLMTAIADEIFLNMEWAGKKYWEENMLESLYFGSQVAGEKIFLKINDLIAENEPLSMEKAEIYLRALSLGFRGKYRGSDDEQEEINLYRNNLFKFIEKNDKSVFLIGHRLFQKEYTYTIPTIHRKLLPDAAIINYICAFFVFMFFVISSIVWKFETRDILQLLNEISKVALRE